LIRRSKGPDRRLSSRAGVGLAVLAALALGCPASDAPRAADRPDPVRGAIVIVSLDTLRSDRLPAYGYDGVETPAIDGLRADGILFERAFSPVPLTTPAHASLLTGLTPPQHGVRDNSGYRLDPARGRTVADRLRDAGYATGAAVSSFTMRKASGLAAGFDHYDDELPEAGNATIGEIQRAGEETLERALAWIDGAPQPFFLLLHLYDIHTPWRPPEPFASRYGQTYEGETAYADMLVGRLIAELRARKLYDDATIILLSDHGEGLLDHGEEEHGILLYRESLQIPLIVKLPRSERAGDVVRSTVEIIDVAPTLLALAGAPPGDDLLGRSLLGVTDDADPRAIYAESYYPQLRFGWSPLRSIIRDRYHYIHGPAPELYDLEADPEEHVNIVADERSTYLELRRAIEAVDANLELPFAEDDSTREALAALGYVGGTTSPIGGSLADPKSQLHTLDPLRDGISALQAGDEETAIVKLQAALELNAGFFDAWQFLGVAYQQLGRIPEAYEAYKEAYRLSGGAPVIAVGLARVTAMLGRHEEAIPLLRIAIEERPQNTELYFFLTRSLIVSQRLPEALEAADETLAAAPDHPDAHYQRGIVAMALDDRPRAELELARALELAPTHIPALSDFAVLRLMQGRPEAARSLLARVLELQPQNPRATELLHRIDAGAPTRPEG